MATQPEDSVRKFLLTEKGKEFIRFVANGTTNGLLVGRNTYNLPFSFDNGTGSFVASPLSDNGQPITNDGELAESLISWFDEYALIYSIDANQMAAQLYAETKFKLWDYNSNGGLGIGRITPNVLYGVLNNQSLEIGSGDEPYLVPMSSTERDTIYNGLTGATPIELTDISISEGMESEIERAVNNRILLHQNIINNPKIMIKAHFALMASIGIRNNNVTASAYLAYKINPTLETQPANSFDGGLPQAIRKIREDKDRFNKLSDGLNYSSSIFTLFADGDPTGLKPRPDISFGFKYKEGSGRFKSADPYGFDTFEAYKTDFGVDENVRKQILLLHPDVQRQALRMFQAFSEAGYVIAINSGYRSTEKQRALFESKGEGEIVAPPGQSHHNFGLALDIQEIDPVTKRYDRTFANFNFEPNGIWTISQRFDFYPLSNAASRNADKVHIYYAPNENVYLINSLNDVFNSGKRVVNPYNRNGLYPDLKFVKTGKRADPTFI